MRKLLAVVLLVSAACGVKKGNTNQTEIQKSGEQLLKVLFIIAHTDFRDEELTEPRKVFQDAGFRTVVASTDTADAEGMLGIKVKPDILITEAEADDFAAIVIAGGSGCKDLWTNTDLIELVSAFSADDKITGAICLAPVILAKAGLLEGKKATCYHSARDSLIAEGALYESTDVVVAGRIVTASGPSAARKFGQTLLDLLTEDTD
ncbi:hypothetical protein GF359_06925 [candidate division WOR-3 bacterium]|uniref:DJ-1/PfpI domain-containing protein n=1 Tax=candidate division WOR-3 bacterium TaxID=2052148 RepID=A0A9D5QDD0_UNCW3|nr:hypothetical protein [candidate division WOR-3 bacterium]MBD3364931.1 hypothetical protein [candidate division WOR-3 bacterium]